MAETRELLQDRRPYPADVDEIADGFFFKQRGINGRLWIGLRDMRENTFGPAALIEIIVNESDSHRRLRRLFAARRDAREGRIGTVPAYDALQIGRSHGGDFLQHVLPGIVTLP